MSATNLKSALRSAINTATEQPIEVPECPSDWIARAQTALDATDDDAMLACAKEIQKAHSEYRAEFDVKGWLYGLRECLWELSSTTQDFKTES
jgi:hypothetical protein